MKKWNLCLSDLVVFALLALFVLCPAFPPAWAGSGPDFRIEKLEFKEAKIVDAVRILSELSGVNIVSSQKAGKEGVTLYLQDMSVRDAIDTLCKVAGLWYRFDEKTRTYRIMTADEYQKDIVVFRDEVTQVFTLRHQNVKSAAQTIENLFGGRVELSLNVESGELAGFGAEGSGQGGGQSSGLNRRETGSGGDDRSSGTGTGGGRGSARARINTDNLKLSADKLAILSEGIGDGKLQQFSEEKIAGVTQHEIPIFITVNPLHNLLFVRTSDKAALKEIAQLVKETDRRAPQVLLEMKILELTVGNSFRSVFDFDLTSSGTAIGPASSQARNPLRIGDERGPNVALGLGNFPLEGGTFIFQALSERIRLRLQMLEGDNKVNVLATPMLLATNNSPARLFIGEERVLVTGVTSNNTAGSTGVVITSITAETEVRDIGNTLQILPRINADRTVTLTIKQDASSVQVGGSIIPVAGSNGNIQEFPIDTVNTANLEANVLAKDGLTVAVGGMIRNSVSKSMQKVPFLGDIPFLGVLFRREVRDRTKTELVLLITPHIFTSDEEAEERSMGRLDTLSRHPYFERGDMALDAGTKGANPDSRSGARGGDEAVYIELTRYAASQVRGDFEARPEGISEVFVVTGDFPGLFEGGQVLAQPVAGWKRENTYVTAVRLYNQSAEAMDLDPLTLKGAWLAASFERPRLLPEGEENDNGVVYLISDQPFHQVMTFSRAEED